MDKLQRIADIYNAINKTNCHPVYHSPHLFGPQKAVWRSLLVMGGENHAWVATSERLSSNKPTMEEDVSHFLSEAEAKLGKVIAAKQEELDILTALQLVNKE